MKRIITKKVAVFVGIIVLLIVGIGIYKFGFPNFDVYVEKGKGQILNYEDCKKEGFAIMESYPEQCFDGKNTFTRELYREEKNIEKEAEQNQNKTILILDASGSMWGKINGKSKIEIARDVVSSTLGNYDDSLDLGLMVYGHREKKNCEDIELLFSPSKNNSENIIQTVNKLQPLGETPMGASVQQAADYLRYKDGKSTVILVSDGIETCGVDICALGKKLEADGIDFTTHVIGFGLKKESTTKMKCLAESTGGTFSLATSEDDLKSAFGEIVEKSSCSDNLPEISIDFPDKVSTDTEFEVSWTGESQLGDVVTIGEIGMENKKDKVSAFALNAYADKKRAKLVAPNNVGVYEVIYWEACGKDSIRKEIEVVKSLVSVNFPPSVQKSTSFDVSWNGPNAVGDTMLMVPVGSSSFGDKLASFGIASHKKDSKYYMNAPDFAGTYEIIYITKKRDVLYRATITVTN